MKTMLLAISLFTFASTQASSAEVISLKCSNPAGGFYLDIYEDHVNSDATVIPSSGLTGKSVVIGEHSITWEIFPFERDGRRKEKPERVHLDRVTGVVKLADGDKIAQCEKAPERKF
jgi:opacity protein-like surface antigen